jgi:hypothetical protein
LEQYPDGSWLRAHRLSSEIADGTAIRLVNFDIFDLTLILSDFARKYLSDIYVSENDEI